MANTESDATYCSEVEKQNLSQRRRSKRLSQKLLHSFRSNGYQSSTQRFEKIYQMLKSESFCQDWSIDDWSALKIEINSINRSLRGVAKSRISFVEKKIGEILQKSFATSNEDIEIDDGEDVSCEAVTSPNVLAGMTTDILTELPPYQAQDLSNLAGHKMDPKIFCTQVNALDLTKRIEQGSVEANVHPAQPTENENNEDTAKDSVIDMSSDSFGKENRNASSALEVLRTPQNKVQTSKRLEYLLPLREPQPITEKLKTPSPVKEKPGSFKESLLKLYKENRAQPSKIQQKQPMKPKICRKETSKPKQFRNTESMFQHNYQLTDVRISPRNVQSERVCSMSPDFYTGDLISLGSIDFSDESESLTSLPLSLKEGFKKIFGTDSLNDILGFERVRYKLTERHVKRLSDALNVDHDTLKRAIERILADDNCDDVQSGSSTSVVECSQSPTQRLFPSQRSQLSK